MEYGYIRVSSIDQNEDSQLIALRGKGCRTAGFTWISNPGRILTGPNTSVWLEGSGGAICCIL